MPGAALLILGTVIVKGWNDSILILSTLLNDSGIPYSLLFVMGVIFSYLAGIILSAVGYMIENKEYKRKTSELKLELWGKNALPSDDSYVYDFIQYKAPAAGSRLAKLSAEGCMCRVLFLGFSLLVILHCLVNWKDFLHFDFWIALALLIVGIVAVFWFRKHLKIRSHELMRNYWHILEH